MHMFISITLNHWKNRWLIDTGYIYCLLHTTLLFSLIISNSAYLVEQITLSCCCTCCICPITWCTINPSFLCHSWSVNHALFLISLSSDNCQTLTISNLRTSLLLATSLTQRYPWIWQCSLLYSVAHLAVFVSLTSFRIIRNFFF